MSTNQTTCPQDPSWRNWAGTVTSQPTRYETARTVHDVVTTVRGAAVSGVNLRVLGSGHSFSSIAATDGVALRLADDLPPMFTPDSARVSVPAGLPLHRLTPALDAAGRALPNLGDIDRQTLAGAVSTGTHGTGAAFGGLAASIRGLQLVLANGEIVNCTEHENPDILEMSRISLGALGVITQITVETVPQFALEVIDQPLPLEEVLGALEEYVAEYDHFEFFWFPYTSRALTRRFRRRPAQTPLAPLGATARRVDDALTNEVWGTVLKGVRYAPRLIPSVNRLLAGTLSKREYTDLSHKVFASRRDVRFRESEWALPRAALPHTLAQIRALYARLEDPVAFPLEIRFGAPEQIPLATSYGRDTAYLAFHQAIGLPYERYFEQMEAILAEVGARPHWGKMHSLTSDQLADLYPRFADFVAMRDRLDPGRLFSNDYLRRVLP